MVAVMDVISYLEKYPITKEALEVGNAGDKCACQLLEICCQEGVVLKINLPVLLQGNPPWQADQRRKEKDKG